MWLLQGVLLALMASLYPAEAIVGCDCNRSLKTEMYSLFRSEPCQRNEAPVVEKRMAAFVEKGDSLVIKGYRCSGLVTKTSYLCDTLSYNYLTRAASTSPLVLTVQDCIMAATRGMWTIQIGNHATGVKVSVGSSVGFQASSTGTFPDERTGSCTHRTNYEIHSGTIEIEEIEVKALPDMSQVISGGHIMPYSAEMGLSGTSDGTYVWTEQPLPCDRRMISLLHEGEVEILSFKSMTFVRSSGETNSFQIHSTLGGPEPMCGGIARETQVSTVYLLVSFPDHRGLSRVTRPNMMSLMQGLSSYIYNSLSASMEQDLAEVEYQFCLARRQDLQLRVLMLSLHPGLDVPLDPEIPCTFAAEAGEAIMLATCARVEIRIAQNSTCFEDVPIALPDGSEAFMSLPSRKIIPESRKIDCGSRVPKILEENGVWYSPNSMVEPRPARALPVSREIPSWKTAALPKIDTSGIYRTADIKRLRAALEAPGASEIRTLRRLDALAGVSIDRTTLKDHLDEVTDRVPDIISGWMLRKGYVVGGWFGFAVMLLGCFTVLVGLIRCALNLKLLGGKVPLSRAIFLATSEAYTAVRYVAPTRAPQHDSIPREVECQAADQENPDRLAQSSYLRLAESKI
ncbi:putative glycoprotein [Beihai barnacle virus 9]|uniref:Putative glycoprotein n=1 Tax=Beihai barnacle virus 9 TaxID=1922367 RepID=A0A1L3KMQ7_9VIRU|nr:putative glycoprotein [Beihai barnacle virus 9]APG78653.1 putative glycoprotein [Beihai barnacle virus 9]